MTNARIDLIQTLLEKAHASATECESAEQVLRLQHDILAHIASGMEASQTLVELCLLVEKIVPQSCATVSLYDPAVNCLNLAAAPSLTDEVRKAFASMVPGEDVGSCGAAVLTKQPVIVEDTRQSACWRSMQEFVRRFNLLACWSIPILDENDIVLGTFAIAHNRVIAPTEDHLRVLEIASYLGSIAIRRKRDEQQLRFSQFSVDQSSAAIFWIGSDAHIVYANQAACESLGYTRDALLSMKAYEVTTAISEDTWASVAQMTKDRGHQVIESMHRRKDGSLFPVEVITNHLEFDGEEYHVAFVQDITQRQLAEEQQRRRRDGLARVTHVSSMGEMASSIAHELNQPLAAVANYTFVLEKLAAADDPDIHRIRSIAATVREQALRAGMIVEGVRSLVKKTAPDRTSADIHSVIGKAVTLLQPDLRQNQIEVVEAFKRGLPPLQIDPVQIEQILINLIRNSMEAMQELPAGQREIVLMTSRTEEDQIEVCVKDNGPGLPIDQQESLFEAFHTTKPNGMGMGLAICRSIAESHMGRLTADRDSTPGATFRLTLPIDCDDLGPADQA